MAAPGPLIAIVGQTASGKSALAMELAQKFNGEIICADARTVYRGMDIGTAKPSAADRAAIPHHLLDVIDPGDVFTVADFKRLAQQAIENILSRDKLPILVGGTGLYVDAVLYDYQFRPVGDPIVRQALEQLSVEQLQAKVDALGLPMPQNDRNPRHLIRVIETNGESSQRSPLRGNTLLIGIELENDVLRGRVAQRVESMLAAGFIEEVAALRDRYDTSASAFDTPGYRPFLTYLEGNLSLEEAKEMFIQNDLHLAKRQKTWFKRNKSIHWISNVDSAVAIATTFMNKSTQ